MAHHLLPSKVRSNTTQCKTNQKSVKHRVNTKLIVKAYFNPVNPFPYFGDTP